MVDAQGTKKKSWFERNPKKTIVLFLLFVFVMLLYSADKIIELKYNRELFNLGKERYIRLKEPSPLYNGNIFLGDDYLKETDSLSQKSFRVRVDESGFIIPSKRHDRPDLSLVFLGGSTTESLYVNEENRFPYLVGKLLEQQTGKRINSYNGGVSGNNTLHSINALLNKVIPLNPEIVIMNHNINDLNILLLEKTYWNRNPSRSPIIYPRHPIYNILKNARYLFIPYLYLEIKTFLQGVGMFKNDEFAHRRNTRIGVDNNRLVDKFEMNLQTFVSICVARKIKPVLMTQPNRLRDNPDSYVSRIMKKVENDYGINYRDYKEIYDQFNDSIRKVGKKNNVLVIDLDKLVPKEKKYMYDVVHFNDAGSRFAARIINKKLLENIEFSKYRLK